MEVYLRALEGGQGGLTRSLPELSLGAIVSGQDRSHLSANPPAVTEPHDTARTATLSFLKSFAVAAGVGAVCVLAFPVVAGAAAAALTSVGVSMATLAFSGQVVVAGAVGYGAYEVGHTAIEVRQDIAAGRLDAAASKLGALAGTVTGGAGASKLALFSFR